MHGFLLLERRSKDSLRFHLGCSVVSSHMFQELYWNKVGQQSKEDVLCVGVTQGRSLLSAAHNQETQSSHQQYFSSQDIFIPALQLDPSYTSHPCHRVLMEQSPRGARRVPAAQLMAAGALAAFTDDGP